MLVIAFSVTLRAHLQRVVVSTELEALLPSWEADQVRMNSCPPALIAMKLTHLINEAVGKNEQRSDFYALYLEQLVGELINCLGEPSCLPFSSSFYFPIRPSLRPSLPPCLPPGCFASVLSSQLVETDNIKSTSDDVWTFTLSQSPSFPPSLPPRHGRAYPLDACSGLLL